MRPGRFTDDLDAVAAVNRALADAVSAAVTTDALPLVAGGNCNVGLGMTAGLGAGDTAVVWFDAHGDFNTPETTPSGFLDGMPLAMAVGRAHAGIWAQRMGAVDPRAVVHVGGRDLDPGEVEGFAAEGVHVVTCAALRGDAESGAGGLPAALAAVASRAARAYVHVDIDVLDLGVAPAVDFPAPGGLAVDEVVAAATGVSRVLPVAGISVTAFNPQREDDDTTLKTGIELMCRLADVAARQ